MTRTDHAALWRTAMRRAQRLNPDRIAGRIVAAADTGLRAARYDAVGGRTCRLPCREHETCEEGPGEHSHLVVSDPTGNTATRGAASDRSSDDLRRLTRSHVEFVSGAAVVLEWVSGERPHTWQGVLTANAKLMPGSVQAGLDVDDWHRLPGAIAKVDRAVSTVAAIARDHLPRDPSTDEQHWTAGLADEDCCAWHLAIHRRYRRPRLPGKNICQDCVSLALLLGQRPPAWLLEAEVDRETKPRAWSAALGRCMDELDIPRDRAS